MKTEDKPKFLKLMTGIADYYGKALSTSVIGLYWEGLKHYDLVAVERALWEHTQNPDTGQYMPKNADVTRVLQGRTQDQASLAWSKVDGAIRKVGTYRDVAFDDATIHRVIADMGGWIGFGNRTEDEWPFVAREFENRYRGYRIRAERPEYPPLLIGIANAQNNHAGHVGQEPIFIGDAGAAKQVYLGGTDRPLIPMQSAGDSLQATSLKRLAA